MNKSSKAVLLSALVFPGTGHFYLKKTLHGFYLAGSAIIALYFQITKSVESAQQINDKIERSDVPLDVGTISELVSNSPTGADALLLKIATVILVVCWLIGIIDSYRVGRAQDKIINNV